MALRRGLIGFDHRVRLKGDHEKHEQTDAWSNRDLIPLPPERRTWKSFNFFGFWAIASLNVANWQTPSTYLSKFQSYDCRAIPLTEYSHGPLRPSSNAHHSDEQDSHRTVLDASSLDRVEVAHWIYRTE